MKKNPESAPFNQLGRWLVRVTFHDRSVYSGDFKEVLEAMQQAAALQSPDVEIDNLYDDCFYLVITGCRDATAEEIDKAMALAAEQAKQREVNERAQLESLKAKYEGK